VLSSWAKGVLPVFLQQHTKGRQILVKPEKLFEELKALAEQCGVEVIVDKGSFRGGSCTVHTERKIVVNRFLPPEGKAAKLAESLQGFSLKALEGIYIKPALREYLSGYIDLEDLNLPAISSNKAVKRTKDAAVSVETSISDHTNNAS
jgi:hypothetical protein